MKRKILLVLAIFVYISFNIALILSFIGLSNYISLKNDELAFQESNLKNAIIDSCLEKSIVKTPEKEEPILYIYDICMKDKGAETVYSYVN